LHRRTILALALLATALAGCGEARAAEWRTLRPATLERTEVAAARTGDGIYVVGGIVPGDASSPALERDDIRRDRRRRRVTVWASSPTGGASSRSRAARRRPGSASRRRSRFSRYVKRRLENRE
jgi:hypothetical protein